MDHYESFVKNFFFFLSQAIVSMLKTSPKLVEIDLSFCKHISDEAVQEILRHCRYLSFLNLAFVESIVVYIA